MEIETKFNIGDRVWVIDQCRRMIETKCPICNGDSYVNINGTNFKCPSGDCYKGYVHHWEDKKWRIYLDSIVGNIKVEVLSNSIAKVEYMIEATGIGTGNVWKENLLFATKEEAQARCDELNKELLHQSNETK